MDSEDILRNYRNRACLEPQDVVKCFLKMHKHRNNLSYYDHRVKLWKLRPGDVVFVNGSFHPVVSYARIDDTLKGVKCGHMEEMGENRYRTSIKCDCRKWYLYYKLDTGKMKRYHPPWDGLTCIPAESIDSTLREMTDNETIKPVRDHFTKHMLVRQDIDKLLRQVRSFSERKNEPRSHLHRRARNLGHDRGLSGGRNRGGNGGRAWTRNGGDDGCGGTGNV